MNERTQIAGKNVAYGTNLFTFESRRKTTREWSARARLLDRDHLIADSEHQEPDRWMTLRILYRRSENEKMQIGFYDRVYLFRRIRREYKVPVHTHM